MALNYLLDPMFQIENSAGKPATDGWLEVYIHGTRDKYYCASNFDGTLHPFKIKLDSLGSNIVLADDGQSYDVYAYNRFGSLLMSRYNVQPGSGGSGSGGTVGELQHWLGMYGPTYTHFPGDDAGHTLGIPRQSVDYVGDFIDHIETAPYPDGDVPAYIYLKPGLYHIDCVIRYQQDTGDIKNTLDEVLIYTGHGNANEDVAYQLDASGPETNGNRHCLKQSFIRKVTEDDGGLLYFAPGTPTDWTDAYIQTLSIVKLDGVRGQRGETGATGSDGKSAYEVWLEAGHSGTVEDYLEDIKGATGAQGARGETGAKGEKGDTGARGEPGVDGATGADGQSAYELWLEEGHTGSEEDFLNSLKGEKGDTGAQGEKGDTGEQGEKGDTGPAGEIPFTVPFEAGDGIIMELDSDGEELKVIISVDSDSLPPGETGATGADGKSAYEIWLENGNTGSEQDFLDSLVGATGATGEQGEQGVQGATGADGLSAYEIWLENGHTGSEQDFLDSLVGPRGATGEQGVQGEKGDTGSQGEKGDTGAQGEKGDTGAQGEKGDTGAQGEKGDTGAQGDTGADGLSAYEVWLENGHTGTESDFLNSLKGEKGDTGAQGEKGDTGADGTTPPVLELVAGRNITFVDSDGSVVINAEGEQYQAGAGIDIDANGVISVDSDSLPPGPRGATGAQGEKGDTGERGATGATGPEGPRGETGADGFTPPVLNVIAGQNISIVDSDGSVIISASGSGSGSTDTVLWSGSESTTMNLSESVNNFESFKLIGHPTERAALIKEEVFSSASTAPSFVISEAYENYGTTCIVMWGSTFSVSNNGSTFTYTRKGHTWELSNGTWSVGTNYVVIDKIIGVNRIQGGN